MNWSLQRHEELSSTIDAARAAAESGCPEGTVILAARQTAGRGRQGRSWASPQGGLWLSVVLRPQLPIRKLWRLGLAAAVAAAEAIEQEAGLAVGLKWPNDLVVKERKLGGLLLDSHPGPPGFAILSLGLNVNVAAGSFPDEVRPRATSILIETGRELPLEEMLHAFLARLAACYNLAVGEENRIARLLAAWQRRDLCLGRRVRVIAGDREVAGLALGLDGSGALRLRTEESGEIRLAAGEVTYLQL